MNQSEARRLHPPNGHATGIAADVMGATYADFLQVSEARRKRRKRRILRNRLIRFTKTMSIVVVLVLLVWRAIRSFR